MDLKRASSIPGWTPNTPNLWSSCSKTWNQGSIMCKNISLKKTKKLMSRSTWLPKTYKNQRNRTANTASASTMLATNISTWNSATRLLLVATRICLDTSLSSSIELYITLMHMVFAKISWNRSWINTLISRARFQVTWSTSTTGLFKSQCWTSRGASLSKFARDRTSTGWSRI